MAMPQRDETIEEIKRLDLLLVVWRGSDPSDTVDVIRAI